MYKCKPKVISSQIMYCHNYDDEEDEDKDEDQDGDGDDE